MAAEQSISTSRNDVTSGKSYSHIRRIKDFPKLMLNHQVGHRYEFFRSKLSNDDQEESTLSLILYPGGYEPDFSDYVAIRASLDQEIDGKIVIDVAICGRENEDCFKRRIVLTKDNHRRAVVKDFVGKSVLLNNVDYLHNNDLLKIACHLTVSSVEKETALDTLEYLNAHMDNYGKLFESEELSDFKLTIKDMTFNVHRCILAAHSPVFAAMFRSDMSEKSQASTEIQDVDSDIMKQLLRFIYTGKVNQLEEIANSLWIAADRYGIDTLKDICEQKLVEMLSVDSIVETLCFLDKFNTMRKLKAAVIKCIIDNGEVIRKDDKFKATIKTLSSDLLSDVLCASLKNSLID